jgi:hypothetical protein
VTVVATGIGGRAHRPRATLAPTAFSSGTGAGELDVPSFLRD